MFEVNTFNTSFFNTIIHCTNHFYNNKKELEIYFTDLAPGSIKLLIRFWISKFKQKDQLSARNEAIKKIKEVFDVNGVVVPNPFPVFER